MGSLEIVHINEPFACAEYLAAMYESEAERVRHPGPRLSARDGGLWMQSRPVALTKLRVPGEVGWGKNGVEVVIECSGLFCSQAAASEHLRGGAKRVYVAGPSIDVPFVLRGVSQLQPRPPPVLCNGPRSVHCAGLLMKTLQESFGVEVASVSVMHAGAGERCVLARGWDGGGGLGELRWWLGEQMLAIEDFRWFTVWAEGK